MIVGIVGLGLMGGSMGLTMKSLEFIDKVVGFDHNKLHCKDAILLNLVDEIVDWEGLKKSDVIFLAIPVEGIINALSNLIDISPDTTIIDLGSTKAKIIENIPTKIRKNFVAAHPMTGTEKFGPTAALKNLYKDKIVVLCNLDDSGKHQRETAWMIFEKMDMKIVIMDAKEHDRHAAYISHLPHAISYALANAVMAQEDVKNILILAAGGFKDMSRLAKSSPVMWEEIFKQNKKNLLKAMDRFEEELKRCKKFINDEEWKSLHDWMKDANKLHDIL